MPMEGVLSCSMLTLYYANGTCALASHLALEYAGAAYQVVRVDFSQQEQRSPDYLRLNPKGRVPALVTERGVLTETPALLQFISQSFPKPDEPEPNRQRKTSVVRKIFGRSTDLRPCKCSRASRVKCHNPLGSEAFCLSRLGRRNDYGITEFFSENAKT